MLKMCKNGPNSKPSSLRLLRPWTAILVSILINTTAGYMLFSHNRAGLPLHYLKVIRRGHPHHAAGHHSPSIKIRLHPSLHGHMHYGDDYPHHSGTHYHTHHQPHSHGHHHNHGTLHGYELQGVAQAAPSYQGTSQPQQNDGYYDGHYDGENYYADTPQQGSWVQYNGEAPQQGNWGQYNGDTSQQGSWIPYNGQPQKAEAQHGLPQQNVSPYSGAQLQPVGPYDQPDDGGNHNVGGSESVGAARNYGFHCKYSYGPHGKLEQCKDEPPPPSPQYGASVLNNPGAGTSGSNQQGQGDTKNSNTYVDPYSNENYVYVPAPWD